MKSGRGVASMAFERNVLLQGRRLWAGGAHRSGRCSLRRPIGWRRGWRAVFARRSNRVRRRCERRCALRLAHRTLPPSVARESAELRILIRSDWHEHPAARKSQDTRLRV